MAASRPLYLLEKPGTQGTCIGGSVGPQTGLDGCIKFRWAVQPVTSRYTDCATPAHFGKRECSLLQETHATHTHSFLMSRVDVHKIATGL
jgi:hypothetical protein